MCEIVQGFVDEGKEEVIRQLIDAKAISVEQIADALKLPVAEVKKIANRGHVEA